MTDPYTITKDDVAAIREAECVIVFWHPENVEEPTSGIRLTRNVRFMRDDAEQTIARIARSERWKRTHVSDYQIDYERFIAASVAPQIQMHGPDKARWASWVGQSLRAYDSVRSVLRLLRAGDQIGVYFVGSNNNELNDKIGWVRDECYLRIHRGRQSMEFLMGVQVGPNNSARMVVT